MTTHPILEQPGHDEWARVLGHLVAESGLDAHAVAVQRVVRTARAASVLPVQVDIVADRTLSEAIRLRGFAHLLGWFMRREPVEARMHDAA